MHKKIGIKYEETRAKLRERIRKGEINALETQAENNACYFCRNHIDEKMFVLNFGGPIENSEVGIDDMCYKRAKLFVYCKNIPLSMN